MRRKQIEALVKLFGFHKYAGKDSYDLRIKDSRVILYYYEDKPKGWRINIWHDTLQGCMKSYCLNKPIDLVTHLMDVHVERSVDLAKGKIFAKLDDIRRIEGMS